MKYLLLGILLISILALAGCSQTVVKYQCADGSFVDSATSCSSVSCKTDCPQLDCANCPPKIEYQTKEVEKASKAETSLKRAKQFLFEMNALLDELGNK